MSASAPTACAPKSMKRFVGCAESIAGCAKNRVLTPLYVKKCFGQLIERETSCGAAVSEAQEAQRLDTPLAEAIHARSREPSDEYRLRTAGQRFDAGYSDNGGGTGCAGSRLISSFSPLPGLK